MRASASPCFFPSPISAHHPPAPFVNSMSHYYSSANANSRASYASSATTTPMNYAYEYSSSAESSSSAYVGDSSNYAGCLPSDLPDLDYDQQGLPSPPSATSSNMISTPPLDWAQPWVSIQSKSDSNLPPYQQPWQSSPLVSERPMVHPIDTDCNWIYQPQQQSGALEPSSILFSSYEQPHAHSSESSESLSSSSHAPQAQIQQSAHTHFGFISPSSTGATALNSSSPLSESTTVSPSALTLYPTISPPYPASGTSQVSLKLHQPRPSRRIPIVSLSKLALACDDFQINRQPKEPKETPSAQVNLPFGTHPSNSYHPMAYQSSNQFIKQSIHPKNDIYGMSFPSGATNNTGRITQCSCGCMTPYVC